MAEGSRSIPQVILVHGTGASCRDDEGPRWWQRGSSFWKSLHQDLRGEAELVGNRTLFRWERDENRASARHEAAQSLLAYLKRYEDSGIPYHLVGHSHGGTVVWQALKLSFRNRPALALRFLSGDEPPLKHLLSWTTIGTPFIHRRVKTAQWAAAGVVTMLVLFTWAASTVAALTLALFENWLYAGLLLGGGWLLFFLLSGVVTSYDDGRAVRRENMLNGPLLACYGRMWFGIWSRQDEAINSLRLAAKLQLELMPDRPWRPSPFAGWLRWALVPAKLTTRMARRLFRPLVDSWVSRLVRRKALGDDRPAPESLEVSCAPFAADVDDLCLDSELSSRLRKRADEALCVNLSELRSWIAESSQSPGVCLEEITSGWSRGAAGLVHTSYFEEEGVRKLVAAHIGLAQGSEPLLEQVEAEDSEAVRRLKSRVRKAVAKLSTRRPGLVARAFLATPSWVIIVAGAAVAMWLSYMAITWFTEVMAIALSGG